jgi:putative endonuclease
LGAIGEESARRYFGEKGWPVLARNWRCPEGELDLIVQEGETIVFVEVRTRSSLRFGTPEESLTAAKRSHLMRAGETYLEAAGLVERDWRVDLIAIECSRTGTIRRFDHIRDVLDDPNRAPIRS